MKHISVIVPMFNEARHIVRTLDGVHSAAVAAQLTCELIVVDNGSTDNSPQLARDNGARVLDHPGLSIGALRNRGVASATSDWLVFLDADIEVPENWLLLWKELQATHHVDVLALECNTPHSAPWFARVWQRRSQSGSQQARKQQWLSTQNLCMARSWFDRVNGFDEHLRTGEDKDFGLRLHRAGARQLSLATSMVQHWGFENTWREWAGKELWRQGSHVQLLKNTGLNMRLLRFPLLCLSTGLLSLLALLYLLGGQWTMALLALLASAIAPLVLALRQLRRQRDPLFVLQLWLLHWVRLHLGAVALVQGLFNRSVVRPDRG
ncbi:glycosyl transferase family 2 [Pseudomonas protegens]|uniref:glycosyltransferase n=1 Tax=Pseudomonas protegens TaxID=380021 RepID=UPI000F4D158B|nr:glycosyltransferase [Pseudomonas protegens]ROL80116.1 glycosyl transferase family 2 [Pseudomonas protegens]